MKNRKFLVGLALAVAFILIPAFSHAQATTTVTVISPNGGEFWPLTGNQIVSWSAPSLPANAQMQIELIPAAGATSQCPNRAMMPTTPNILGQAGISVNIEPFCRGQYMARVGTWQNDVFISDTSDNFFTISETVPITVTSPNSGEVWQLARTHSILWSPYNPGWVFDGVDYVYHPELAINPASTTVAYLQKMVDNNFVTVGKIVELGMASTYFDGYLVGEFQEPIPHPLYPNTYIYDPPPFLATPGQYYVKLVNKITGAWDRSNQPFTLAPENSIWANLKINGVDVDGSTPIVVPEGQNGAAYSVSWASNSLEKCNLDYFFSSGSPGEFSGNNVFDLSSTGTTTVFVFPFVNVQHGALGYIGVRCPTSISGSGIEGGGYMTNLLYYGNIPNTSSIPPATGTKFVRVVSPNTGGNIIWSYPYQITWEVSTDVENVSIALYKNSAFYKWIARDLPAQIKSYRWIPSRTISSSELGSNYQISLIGRNRVSTGTIIQDKSDKPFSLVTKGGGGGPYQNQITRPGDLTANTLSALSALLQSLQNLLRSL